jgi:AcrR family transcriptional regulator
VRAVPSQIAAKVTLAAELFADRGLDGTKIDDVAAATGIPKATLYYYFSGKEEILAFLLQDTLTRIADEVAIAVERDGSGAERLMAVIEAQLAVMAEQPAVCRALIGELGRAGRIPEIAKALQRAYYTPVETLLADGVADGSLVAQSEPATVALALFGATTITGLAFLVSGASLDALAVAGVIRGLVLEGLQPR